MLTKKKEIKALENQNERLRKMYEAEKEKTAGYEELSKIQEAYIAILLKKLGATEEHPVIIANEDIKAILGVTLVTVNVVEKGKWEFFINEA